MSQQQEIAKNLRMLAAAEVHQIATKTRWAAWEFREDRDIDQQQWREMHPFSAYVEKTIEELKLISHLIE